ncbi:MAG: molybdenum cofactor biosynthesis protein MoaE [Cyclobacteriaceae bacterium]|jgi:molybdopterin synthase catalytic subunit|nr:molybdenum cofactor biosynthesis protein MoaE [Cyclobacteriaceae bacterium]
MIQLTPLPIDTAAILAQVTHVEAGGLVVFVGNVRNHNARLGKHVLRLEYEAYEAMALKEIERIVEEAHARWPIKAWAVCHRTGTVLPGEAAVVLAVTTPHRKESFEACQFIIDQLKARVPIWKKEVFDDGDEWVSAHP